jgi:rare lipoprotein A
MNRTILSGLAATALTTAVGTTLFLFNGLQGTLASSPKTKTTPEETTIRPENNIQSTAPTFIENTVTPRILTPQNQQSSTALIADIVSHAWQDGRLAVILRVRNIPVMAFLGTSEELKASANSQPITTPESVIGRSRVILDRLNQLAQDPNFDAASIIVDYDKKQRLYSIQVSNEDLIRLDPQNTVLPDAKPGISFSTRLAGKNALQIANRLRRLMGDAPPLTNFATAPLRNSLETLNNLPDNTPPLRTRIKSGIASWYGPGFHGRRTANGERYNQNSLTAAHKSLPFGTQVLVTNLVTGRSVMVRINDRGPFVRGRVIDLSASAARAIGVYSRGTAPVALEVVSR